MNGGCGPVREVRTSVLRDRIASQPGLDHTVDKAPPRLIAYQSSHRNSLSAMLVRPCPQRLIATIPGRSPRCQEVLGYRFRNLTLLQEALTHASGANHRLASNERLEFLGDAILGAIVCEMLFRKFPDYLEGDLTRIKSIVVSRRTCAKISEELGIDEFLVIGKGMGSHDQTPPSVLADVFESLIGAIYLDGGIEAAQAFIVRHIEPEIDAAVDGQGGLNYKSNLQQIAQREYRRDAQLPAAR